MTKKKIVLTGATGLLGKKVVEKLLDDDHDLFVVSRKKPKFEFARNDNINWICSDCSNTAFIDELPLQADAIIHMANADAHWEFPKSAMSLYNVNIMATMALLEYARKSNAEHFVLLSTGGLYSGSEAEFLEGSEISHEPLMYLTSKHCAELLAETYSVFFNVIILRPFFIYGPNQKQEMLISRLIDSVYNEKSVRLEGTNGIFLNPLYVDDAAVSVIRALGLKDSFTINIAGPQIISLREICNKIGNLIGKEPIYTIVNHDLNKKCIGNIDLMSSLLFKPTIDFNTGIERTLLEFKI